MSVFWERFSQECEKAGKKPNSEYIRSVLGISSSAISKWKNGTVPDGNTLVKIAMQFKVTTDYLLGLSWVEEEKDKEKADLPQSALDPQIEELVRIYRECDALGQFSIISTAMEEHARSMREKNAHMA